MRWLKAIGFALVVNVCVLLAVVSVLTLLAILGTVASKGITLGWALVAMCALSAVTWFYLACSLIGSVRTR